ncbi:MAG TPA: AmmeMemoRadiSam system protein B [Anaerolineales bacterium]|nr:AmmeMemoRadiSam system protein B [Anaerolineales bacterium]
MSEQGIRPSPISGLWYEGNPQLLAQKVDGYLDDARLPDLVGRVVAVMSPHAGHIYSGSVAGYAFASVRGMSPDLVVVIGPMHHPYSGSILVSNHDAYSTPLGTVPVDQEIIHQLDLTLMEDFHTSLTPINRDKEHSVEIVLPFLQRALHGKWSLIPLMVREQTQQVSENLGKALARILEGRKYLLVASTDLSHFFAEKQACQLDKEMLRQVESFSPAGIFSADLMQTGFACGLGALAAVLTAAKELGANKVQILKHATSGEITGDYDRVVGYGAAVVLNTPQ